MFHFFRDWASKLCSKSISELFNSCFNEEQLTYLQTFLGLVISKVYINYLFYITYIPYHSFIRIHTFYSLLLLLEFINKKDNNCLFWAFSFINL